MSVQFGVVTKQTGFFTCSGEATSDGILGLAYDALAIGAAPILLRPPQRIAR